MSNKTNILAVVVTYNRLDCLKECVAALRMQTYKQFEILIINNGSIDGTKEWVEKQNDLLLINQENLGGAGGFYTGMKYMYDHHYEWLWMMDDDGMPDPSQLEMLLKYKGDYLFLNALVVNKNDHSRLSFENMNLVSEFDEMTVTEEFLHPFNGTFIHWSVIDRVGFIKKEMYIWGDEQEYRKRVNKNGYREATIIPAIHYHPCEKGKKLYVIPYICKRYVWDKPKAMSWIYYRNLGYIDKTYQRRWCSGMRNVIDHIIAFSWRLRFRELFKFLKYYSRGRQGNFNI